MAAKQTDYLAGLLDDEPGDPGSRSSASAQDSPTSEPSLPRSRSGATTLLSRESALARVASGEVRQVTQVLLDPSRVRIWLGNARIYGDLSEDSCRELISSILAEGGQKVPAVVRRVEGVPDIDYEVIAGTRRHFAVSWLRNNAYPEMRFLAQVADLNDEAAFRLADLENRARRDVTDLERARNYAAALERHYGAHQTRMAERLRLSKGWLSKLLKVAAIPDVVISAFASPADVQLKPAYPLAQALDNDAAADAIIGEARRIADEQRTLRDRRQPLIPAPEVLRRLLAAPTARSSEERPELFRWITPMGRPGLTVLSANRQGVTVRLHAGSGASLGQLADVLREALRDLERNGMGLQR
ncbi:MAG: ParB/RepB/Spo0J family partition protein [Sphingomonadaceae bacterium]|nr:ParB/RepB/Spo0J family partition protein [Sphingomonadaceae bacterium]